MKKIPRPEQANKNPITFINYIRNIISKEQLSLDLNNTIITIVMNKEDKKKKEEIERREMFPVTSALKW